MPNTFYSNALKSNVRKMVVMRLAIFIVLLFFFPSDFRANNKFTGSLSDPVERLVRRYLIQTGTYGPYVQIRGISEPSKSRNISIFGFVRASVRPQ